MAIIPYYKVTRDANGKITDISTDTNLPTPSEVRNRWCYGLPLTNEAGVLMSDEDLLTFLEGAVKRVERELGIFLKPTIIACNPDDFGLQKGVDYEVEEPPYDYDVRAWMQYGFLQLRQRPVQKITGLKLVLPNGNIIMDFMKRPQWIKLYKDNGQIQLVPYAGDPTIFALMGGSQSAYPFVTGTISTNLPQMIYVDYEAGYGLHEIPNDIRNAVAKLAAIDVLGIAGDAVLAGVASLSTSIDGLSESFSTTASATNATYGAHILQYQKEVDELFHPKKGAARTSERGFTITGL
jgi:hypothetical protein